MKKLLLGYLLLLTACQTSTPNPTATPSNSLFATSTPLPTLMPDTPTPEPSPTFEPSPTALLRFFVQEFNDSIAGWVILQAGNDSVPSVNVANGSLLLQIDSAFTWLYALYGPEDYVDVHIETQYENLAGTPASAGLVCRYSEVDGWLELNLSADGLYNQIVLTGQPELRDKLNQKNLRQLKQRVALRCNMHAFPSVEEVDRYITEGMMIAGSSQPNVFTPGAVDLIFQCSEGIPRNINNICDNAMLAAYSACEQLIGRQVIEEVADNLDMLPRHDAVNAAEAALDLVDGRVLRAGTREDLWEGKERTEAVKPRVFTQDLEHTNGHANGNGNGNGYSNGNGHSNGNGNGHAKPVSAFEDMDDIHLEIDDVVGTFRKF